MASGFFEKVYQIVRIIPEGKVTTYGHIARFLGESRSARLVGYAMNASHNDSSIPAHRVVNRSGVLTGKHFFAGSTLMQDLLESEGVKVIEDQIQSFESHLWDPIKHLNPDDFIQDLTG